MEARPPPQRFLSTKAIAEMTGFNRAVIRMWLKDGRLPAVHVAGRWLVPEAEVIAFLTKDSGAKNGKGVPLKGGKGRRAPSPAPGHRVVPRGSDEVAYDVDTDGDVVDTIMIPPPPPPPPEVPAVRGIRDLKRLQRRADREERLHKKMDRQRGSATAGNPANALAAPAPEPAPSERTPGHLSEPSKSKRAQRPSGDSGNGTLAVAPARLVAVSRDYILDADGVRIKLNADQLRGILAGPPTRGGYQLRDGLKVHADDLRRALDGPPGHVRVRNLSR